MFGSNPVCPAWTIVRMQQHSSLNKHSSRIMKNYGLMLWTYCKRNTNLGCLKIVIKIQISLFLCIALYRKIKRLFLNKIVSDYIWLHILCNFLPIFADFSTKSSYQLHNLVCVVATFWSRKNASFSLHMQYITLHKLRIFKENIPIQWKWWKFTLNLYAKNITEFKKKSLKQFKNL